MLPYSVVIKGKAYRATADGSIETIRNRAWVRIHKDGGFHTARARVVKWARNNRVVVPSKIKGAV